MKNKLAGIRVLLFDWDGVFHGGDKNESRITRFSEADSMGVNMLRFGLWLQNGEIPLTAIISGENNPTARFWAQREHLDATFSGAKNKVEILAYLHDHHQVKPDQVLFVFDDVLDLSLAQKVGYRVMISRRASHLFTAYCKKNQYYDYLTQNDGGNHGLREACEYLLFEMDRLAESFDKRIAFSGDYTVYNAQRCAIEAAHFIANSQTFSRMKRRCNGNG